MTVFPEIRFTGALRPSQLDVSRIAGEQISAGNRRLHIVAPPGSGKTVVGLHLWSQLIRVPAVVFSPNSAIQAQWAANMKLFDGSTLDGNSLDGSSVDGNQKSLVSTSAKTPGLLTSLTYQSVTMTARASQSLDQQAIEVWADTLLRKGEAENLNVAQCWIEDLRTHNVDYFNNRLSHYRKKLRVEESLEGSAMQTLHPKSKQTLQRLKQAGVGLLIMDECHHLLGHWGRVLSDFGQYLGDPIVLGLTATPPDRGGRLAADVERYDKFFGQIDYQVPVPAVVKDGFLAPYQDLSYFVRPAESELKFIAEVDQQFTQLMEEMCQPRRGEHHSDNQSTDDESSDNQSSGEADARESILEWLWRELRDHSSDAETWSKFYDRDPDFAGTAARFVESRLGQLPDGVPPLPEVDRVGIPQLTKLLDHYTRRCLRRSPHSADHALAKQAIKRLRMLGVQITETGSRRCASPVSRVIAYTQNKTQALIPILQAERTSLGDRIRAVVIADYEKTSVITESVAHLLDEEAGGAMAAFRAILSDATTNELDPVLLTGSSVLVDSDLAAALLDAARRWLLQRNIDVTLDAVPSGDFSVVKGRGSDWCPRVYVELLTDLFQRGLTRCLVGTRGLLGEGWDADTINVLVDLSTFTTSTTVNQLRGRSIRLNPNDPKKLANNWDVVCIAPEFSKGLDDYHRFIRKHKAVFGICDDGAIEKGVGHVHASFTDLQPELLEDNVSALNSEMLQRSAQRDKVYDQWNIGQPYSAVPIRCVEVRRHRSGPDFGWPAFEKSDAEWTEATLARAIGRTVRDALIESKQMTGGTLQVTRRDGGFVRVFMDDASAADSDLFAQAFSDAVRPVVSPRYVIPRSVDDVTIQRWARWLPRFIEKLIEKRDRRVAMLHAVPASLASRRDLVDIYQKHWHANVSPGRAVFANNAKGEAAIQDAIKNHYLQNATVHEKEIFV